MATSSRITASSSSNIEKVIKQALKTFSFHISDTLNHFNDDFKLLKSLVNDITSEDINFDTSLLTQKSKEVNQYYQSKHDVKINLKIIPRAPVTYIKIFENELITLGVFVVREGQKLPLHNHPLMHGIMKVIAGTLKVKSYTVINETNNSNEIVTNVESPLNESIICYEEDLIQSQDSGFGSQRSHSDSSPNISSSSSLLNYLYSPDSFNAYKHTPKLVSYEDSCIYLTPKDNNLHEIHSLNGPAAFLDIIAPPYRPWILDCYYFKDLGALRSDDKSIRKLQRIKCPSYFYTDEEMYAGPPINV